MNRLGESFFLEDEQDKSYLLPDNCIVCGIELTSEDYKYRCRECFEKDYEQTKRAYDSEKAARGSRTGKVDHTRHAAAGTVADLADS